MTRTLSGILVLSDWDDGASDVVRAYCESLEKSGHDSELVVVNNGLGSDLNASIQGVLEERSLHTRLLFLHRTADDSTALNQGFAASEGEILVVLPPYLQVDTADIMPMVDRVLSGELDCVASWRKDRIDSGSDVRKSRWFNAVTRSVTGSDLHDLNSGLRVLRRKVIDDVQLYGDLYRFAPILAARKGYRVGEQTVRHLEERVKKGDYRFGVYVRRMLDLLTLFFLTKFTSKPLRFFGLVAGGLLGVGALVTLTVVVQWFLGTPLSDRPLLVFGVLLLVLGVQLFSIGLLGELMIFTHARELKEYNVERVFESPRGTRDGEPASDAAASRGGDSRGGDSRGGDSRGSDSRGGDSRGSDSSGSDSKRTLA